jgi:hypothetical protein
VHHHSVFPKRRHRARSHAHKAAEGTSTQGIPPASFAQENSSFGTPPRPFFIATISTLSP